MILANKITEAAIEYRKALKVVKVCKREQKKLLCSICDKWKKCPKYLDYVGKHHKLLKRINAYE
jgi:hypothetical protein